MTESPSFIQSEYERLEKEKAQDIIQLLINVYGAEAVANWMEWKSNDRS